MPADKTCRAGDKRGPHHEAAVRAASCTGWLPGTEQRPL